MKVVANFSHPLSNDAVRTLAQEFGLEFDEVIQVPVQVNLDEFDREISRIMREFKSSTRGHKVVAWVPPGMASVAAAMASESEFALPIIVIGKVGTPPRFLPVAIY